MSDVFQLLKVVVVCGSVLMLAFVILLAMPSSRFRSVCLKCVGWTITVLALLYAGSPLDLLPEAFLGPLGLPDDFLALAMGIGSALTAIFAGSGNKDSKGGGPTESSEDVRL